MIRRLRARWKARRVRVECEWSAWVGDDYRRCGAWIRERDAHTVVTDIDLPESFGGAGGATSTAIYCGVHCPRPCDKPNVPHGAGRLTGR